MATKFDFTDIEITARMVRGLGPDMATDIERMFPNEYVNTYASLRRLHERLDLLRREGTLDYTPAIETEAVLAFMRVIENPRAHLEPFFNAIADAVDADANAAREISQINND